MVNPFFAGMLREVPVGYIAHYVIDASVALKWVSEEEGSDRARRYWRGALEETMRLSVPSLFWYEVANALRCGKTGARDAVSGSPAWELLRTVPVHTVEFTADAFPIIADLALRQDITVYDAAYVFLAQSLEVPLVTADSRLAQRCSNLPYVWLLDSFSR